MGTQAFDPRDHAHEADQGRSSSPVPEKWIPWMVMAMGVALILVAFSIPLGFLPR